MDEARRRIGDRIDYAPTGYEALDGADALVVVTDWNEYRHPDFARIKKALKRPIVVDGRNLYDPAKMRAQGFTLRVHRARGGRVRIVITGAAGFLGSHLCDRFLADGHTVVGLDNFVTGHPDNIAHLMGDERFSFIRHDVSTFMYVAGDVDGVLHFASPGEPDRLSGTPDPDAEGRVAGHAQCAGTGQGQGRAVPHRVHLRGVRRPAGASAEGDVLGEREPDRPAWCLRRGEAIRRGDDHGLPPLPRTRHAHRAHLQHLRAADAAARRARGLQLHRPGAERGADHDLRRRPADAQLLLRRRRSRRDLPPVHAAATTSRPTSEIRPSTR